MDRVILIGTQNKDGSVDSIFVSRNGKLDENKLLYKYYRSPERVNALIKNGTNFGCLARYISRDELNPKSPLYNEEVTMLPIDIGFSEFDFPEVMSERYSTHKTSSFPSLEAFFDVAQREIDYDHDIYLYNPEIENWTIGKKCIPLREQIISQWIEIHNLAPEITKETLEELNSKLDAIDEFIAKRRPHKLKNVNLYLEVTEQIGHSDKPRRIYYLPITQEIENMTIGEIPAYLGIENATIEVFHNMKKDSNVSPTYRATWMEGEQDMISFIIFSLFHAIERNTSMQRTLQTSGSIFDVQTKKEVLTKHELKERLALEVLEKIIDTETLNTALERVRELNSSDGIYDIMEDLEIVKPHKKSEIKL